MMKADDIVSLDSEAGVIATLIVHPEFSYHSEHLVGNHFSNKENRCVYTAIVELVRKGIQNVDTYNIVECLQSSEATRKIAQDVTIEKLNELIDMAQGLARHTLEEFKMLVDNVLDCAFRRDTFRKLKECQALCYDRTQEGVAQRIYHTIDETMTEYSTTDEVKPFKDVVDTCWEEIQSRQNGGFAGIPFKFPTLNEYATIEPGELFIFAAEAKQGCRAA